MGWARNSYDGQTIPFYTCCLITFMCGFTGIRNARLSAYKTVRKLRSVFTSVLVFLNPGQ